MQNVVGMDHYLNKHIPMVVSKFQGLGFPIQIQVDDGLGGGVPGEPAPYATIGYMLFEDIEHLQQGMAAHGAEIMGDIPNFTTLSPPYRSVILFVNLSSKLGYLAVWADAH